MSRETFLIIIGLVVAATPYTGFPGFVEDTMLTFCGVILISLALLWRYSSRIEEAEKRVQSADTFTENGMPRPKRRTNDGEKIVE